jgi:hypothetical protein
MSKTDKLTATNKEVPGKTEERAAPQARPADAHPSAAKEIAAKEAAKVETERHPATRPQDRPSTGPMSSTPAPDDPPLPPIRLGPGQVTGGGAATGGQAGEHKGGDKE